MPDLRPLRTCKFLRIRSLYHADAPRLDLNCGSLPLPATVLKGCFIKGLVEVLVSIMVAVAVRGNDPP